MHYVYSPGGNSVTIVMRGMPFGVTSENPSFDQLIDALEDGDVEGVEDILFAGERLAEDLKDFGEVEVEQGHVTYRGLAVHGYLVDQILLAQRSGIDAKPYILFLNNVMQNPDPRAQAGLFEWVERSDLPLTADGCFLAWKAVRSDYRDHHSGTLDHSVGRVVSQDRNLCDSDPDRTCSSGLHFCSKSYLPHFHSGRSRIVVVKINPADVVAFPRDYDLAKGRCCKYEVLEEVAPSDVDAYFDGVRGYVQ